MFFFKPMDYMHFMFSNVIGFMAGNFLTITTPSIIVIFILLKAPFAVGLNIPFFLCALAGSCFLSFLFDFLIGTTCFWTQSVWGISASKDFIISILSGALIPLQFYPASVINVIRYLPFQYMYNFPLTILTSTSGDPIIWLRGLLLQFVWIGLLFAIVRAYFGFSLRKLTVNGG